MATQHADVKRLRAPFDGFVVDGFNFTKTFPGCRHWLLTHAHSDHTCGLSGGFDAGAIYCSAVTKRLVCRNVSARLGDRVVLINAGDSIYIEELATTVTALDAGHCPGSLLFLLEHTPTKLCVLHTGDMRAAAHIRNQPLLAPFRDKAKKLDALYLDTTYAARKYDFPSQADACDEIKRIVRVELRREPRTLFICNTYSVGKENAFDAVVDASGGTLLVPPRRAEALRLCDRWRSLYREDATDPRINVWVGMPGGDQAGGRDRDQKGPHGELKKLLDAQPRYAAIVSLRCTGWEYRPGKVSSPVWAENDGATRTYGVPYSEHSSFPELEAFVKALGPREIIPTVARGVLYLHNDFEASRRWRQDHGAASMASG
jgi:DNA cross-link repair 1A protein